MSRAIRLTARESFIRLLSLENLDRALPAEVERLHAMKSSTQSKYRFLVHRRTMLLQALNSSADSASNNSSATLNNKDKDGGVVSQLAMQLAQTTAECDRVLEELLRIGDHLSQIERMVDLHWASALAVALRKVGFMPPSISGIALIFVMAVEQKLRTSNVRPPGSARADRAARGRAGRRVAGGGAHSEGDGRLYHDRIRYRRGRHRESRKGISTELPVSAHFDFRCNNASRPSTCLHTTLASASAQFYAYTFDGEGGKCTFELPYSHPTSNPTPTPNTNRVPSPVPASKSTQRHNRHRQHTQHQKHVCQIRRRHTHHPTQPRHLRPQTQPPRLQRQLTSPPYPLALTLPYRDPPPSRPGSRRGRPPSRPRHPP